MRDDAGRKTLSRHEMHGQVDDGGYDGLGRDEWRRRDDDAEASRRLSLQWGGLWPLTCLGTEKSAMYLYGDGCHIYADANPDGVMRDRDA